MNVKRYSKANAKTRIVATLGPATSDPESIRRLVLAGADCFRLNFSHGNGETIQPYIDAIRQVEKEENVFIPILGDIQGPKIRIGKLPNSGITLQTGQDFILTTNEMTSQFENLNSLKTSSNVPADNSIDQTIETNIVHTPYSEIVDDVLPGMRILLSDGNIELKAKSVTDSEVTCEVIRGGQLFSNKGINLPDARLSVETLTDKDREDLAFIAGSDIDLVAVSFVRSAHDIVTARALLGKNKIPVMAKLERPESLENLNEIIETADGVMVARGDLGVELDFDRIPVIQKGILKRASLRGKWAMVATQMLGSMVTSSRPSRAEVSDVANAVLDGADAVMLSEESAIGKYPEAAVSAMAKIVSSATETAETPFYRFEADINSFAAAASGAAISAADRLTAKAIVALAGSGSTALLLSKWHPDIPVLGLSADNSTLRRFNLLRGVIPVKLEELQDMESQLAAADHYLKSSGLGRTGDTTIIVAAIPLGQKKDTNTIRFHSIR